MGSFSAAEVSAGERIGVFFDLSEGAVRCDLAALLSGLGQNRRCNRRSERSADRVRREEACCQECRVFECVVKPFVVVGVEANGRFIENVEAAGQPAAELAGEADPLRFSAAERRRAAVEREIAEADGVQEWSRCLSWRSVSSRKMWSCFQRDLF